jgi:hypothetical protein
MMLAIAESICHTSDLLQTYLALFVEILRAKSEFPALSGE